MQQLRPQESQQSIVRDQGGCRGSPENTVDIDKLHDAPGAALDEEHAAGGARLPAGHDACPKENGGICTNIQKLSRTWSVFEDARLVGAVTCAFICAVVCCHFRDAREARRGGFGFMGVAMDSPASLRVVLTYDDAEKPLTLLVLVGSRTLTVRDRRVLMQPPETEMGRTTGATAHKTQGFELRASHSGCVMPVVFNKTMQSFGMLLWDPAAPLETCNILRFHKHATDEHATVRAKTCMRYPWLRQLAKHIT